MKLRDPPFAETQKPADLLERDAFQIMQPHDRAVTLVQSVEGLDHLAHGLLPGKRLVGILGRIAFVGHYVHHAALQHLEAWARSGVPPPSAPLLSGDAATGIVRNRYGIALGGVRTPWVDCPAQVFSGENGERGEFEALFGCTLPLPPGAVAKLYPGGAADYLAEFAAALRRSTAAGFLLEADGLEILGLAQAQFTALSEGETGFAA